MEDQPQRTRAGQYAICANALTRVSGGAEAVFDQALTNGLAAIVAHAWPGAELEGGANRVRSAAALLDVIKQCGKPAENGTIRVLHDPSGPEYGEPSPFDNEPWPNFTSVNVPVFCDALRVTQAIRHARAHDRDSDAVLTDEHLAALNALGSHPALSAITSELADGLVDWARKTVHDRDATERERAGAYYRVLDADEQVRREAIDYREAHDWETEGTDRSVVERCPVCENWALVARRFDSFTEEVGIGTCHVCSYRRTAEIADEYGFDIDVERAIERAAED